jgi:F-type H+-transporting ATPase subunit b
VAAIRGTERGFQVGQRIRSTRNKVQAQTQNGMQGIGHQLGELFLQAVPTVVIILIFYFILRAIFFQPLMKVMAERDARTIGARKDAEAEQAKAAEKVRQYEEALKQAWAKVYEEQEAARKKLVEERNAQVKDARSKANAEVQAAKQRIDGEAAAARRELEASASQLATEIVRRILQAPRPSAPREVR